MTPETHREMLTELDRAVAGARRIKTPDQRSLIARIAVRLRLFGTQAPITNADAHNLETIAREVAV